MWEHRQKGSKLVTLCQQLRQISELSNTTKIIQSKIRTKTELKTQQILLVVEWSGTFLDRRGRRRRRRRNGARIDEERVGRRERARASRPCTFRHRSMPFLRSPSLSLCMDSMLFDSIGSLRLSLWCGTVASLLFVALPSSGGTVPTRRSHLYPMRRCLIYTSRENQQNKNKNKRNRRCSDSLFTCRQQVDTSGTRLNTKSISSSTNYTKQKMDHCS